MAVYTLRQVADMVCVSVETVRQWVKRGQVDAITLPRRGEKRTQTRITQRGLDSVIRPSQQLPSFRQL